MPASFFSSLLAGTIFLFLRGKFKYFFAIILITLLIYFSNEIFNPQTIVSRNASFYTDPFYLKWTVSKISDEYLPNNFVKPNNYNETPSEIVTGDFDNSDLIYKDKKTHKIVADINLKRETKLLINIAYYPAWNIFIDGRKTAFTILGRTMQIDFPEGKHSIAILFKQTPVEKVANAISFLSIVIVGIIIFRKKLRPNK